MLVLLQRTARHQAHGPRGKVAKFRSGMATEAGARPRARFENKFVVRFFFRVLQNHYRRLAALEAGNEKYWLSPGDLAVDRELQRDYKRHVLAGRKYLRGGTCTLMDFRKTGLGI